jgi:hypothetical protein
MPPPKDQEKYRMWIEHLSESHTGITPWNKGIPQTEEVKLKLSEAQLGEKHWNYGGHHSEETKARMSASAVGKSKTELQKEKQRVVMSGRYDGENNPFFGKHHKKETVELIRQKNLGKVIPNDMKVHLSEVHKKRCANPVVRIEMAERQMGERSHFWKGGVSFDPYCIKFNRPFKERVRSFFDNKCVECGTEQPSRKLVVHHVDFNKNTCCDNTKPLFVLLCMSCHAKTNFNRGYWKPHFTDIINTKYNGKCYLTKDEMRLLNRRLP